MAVLLVFYTINTQSIQYQRPLQNTYFGPSRRYLRTFPFFSHWYLRGGSPSAGQRIFISLDAGQAINCVLGITFVNQGGPES